MRFGLIVKFVIQGNPQEIIRRWHHQKILVNQDGLRFSLFEKLIQDTHHRGWLGVTLFAVLAGGAAAADVQITLGAGDADVEQAQPLTDNVDVG